MLLKKPSFKYELDINKFTNEEELGHGAYGLVCKVQEKESKEFYALKYLDLESNEEKNIYREIEIMIGVNHPTITKCFGYLMKNFRNEEQLSILIEYEEKGSLDKILEQIKNGETPNNFDNTSRQIILVGIARGMKYLHDRNIVHRDLKPGNILLDNLFHPHISDFGLSKNFEQGHDFSQSQFGGTPIYMAPEINANENFDARKADVFAFSILMYEVVTDLIPYPEAKKKGMLRILYLVTNENYRPKFTKEIKDPIRNLIEKCWSSNPDERPNFKEIFNKLSGIVGNDDYLLDGVNKEELNEYVKSITKIDDPIENLLHENEILRKQNQQLLIENQNFHEEQEQKPSFYLEMTISIFNSLPLKMQQIVIADLLSYLTNEEIFLFFIKINNVLLFLLKYKQLEIERCFEIYVDEKRRELALSKIVSEFPVMILHDASDVLFNTKEINSPEFINTIKDFRSVLIEMLYPSQNFDDKLEFALNTLKPQFERGKIFVGVFITGMTETDKNLHNKKMAFVHFDKSITKISGGGFYGSFEGCNRLVRVIIPPSVKSIGDHAFQYSALVEIEIPYVREMGDYVFCGCSYLRKVVFPLSIEVIPLGTFRGCISLKKFTINPNIHTIGWEAFRGCTSLETISFPPSVKEIGRSAFWDCKMLQNVRIPSTVKNIGKYAFPDEIVVLKESY